MNIEYGGLVASPYFGIGWHSDGDATAVTAKGVVPLSERFSLFGKAGLARWSLTSYGFDSDVFGVRVQAERTDFGGLDVDFTSIGFLLRF